MPEPDPVLRRGPAARGLLWWLPVFVAALAVALIEALAPPPAMATVDRPPAPPPPGTAASAEPTTERARLVVFWIDTLSDADLADRRVLKRLKELLPRALHGRVTACADATSVPCFEAMATGWDRASLSTLFRNFGGHSDRLTTTGVLAALHARGKRLGFIGDPFVRGTTGVFDWVRFVGHRPSAEVVEAGLRALRTRGLDLVVIHLVEADAASHRYGIGAEYRRALNRIDAAVADGLERLRPTDHVAIVGDHGHTPDGRHAPGLGVPTYAIYLGPRFARPESYQMAITDHASLWAAVFGLKHGNVTWVERYLAGEPLTRRTHYPVPAGSHRRVPVTGALAVLALAGLLAWPELRRLRPRGAPGRALATLLPAVAALAAGAVYLRLRPALQGAFSDARNLATGALTGALGLLLLHLARPSAGTASLDAPRPPDEALGRLTAGFALLALPTVYPFGGAAVALLGLLATALVLVWRGVNPLDPRARDRTLAAWALAALLLGLTFRRVDMGGFQLFRFHAWRQLNPGWSTELTLGVLGALLGGLLLRRSTPVDRARVGAGLVVGAGACAAVPALPAEAWVAPCVLALPAALAALRSARFDPLALALAPAALRFFYESDAALLLPMAGTLALAALFAETTRSLRPGVRGAGLFVLFWLASWVTFGCRAPGVRFQYFFQWVGAGSAVEDSWVLNGMLTTAKYLLLPVLAALLVHRIAGDDFGATTRVAGRLARLRLALVLAFVAGFFLSGGSGGSNLVYDLVQEVALCGLLALTVALAGAFRGRTGAA